MHHVGNSDTTQHDMTSMDHSTTIHGNMNSMGHSMSMTFHFGVNEVILFDSWKVSSAGCKLFAI